jgi:hypothetical protein
MEQFKQFILRHFEKLLVCVILATAFIGTYLVEEKFIILNFYYLPVLVAGYFLARRRAYSVGRSLERDRHQTDHTFPVFACRESSILLCFIIKWA